MKKSDSERCRIWYYANHAKAKKIRLNYYYEHRDHLILLKRKWRRNNWEAIKLGKKLDVSVPAARLILKKLDAKKCRQRAA